MSFSALLKKLVRDPARTRVLIRGDSELVIRQMRGEYQVRNEKLVPWHLACTGVAAKFREVVYEHIPRDQNAEADSYSRSGAKKGPPIDTGIMPVFYPALSNFVIVRVNGMRTLAAQDMGAEPRGCAQTWIACTGTQSDRSAQSSKTMLRCLVVYVGRDIQQFAASYLSSGAGLAPDAAWIIRFRGVNGASQCGTDDFRPPTLIPNPTPINIKHHKQL